MNLFNLLDLIRGEPVISRVRLPCPVIGLNRSIIFCAIGFRFTEMEDHIKRHGAAKLIVYEFHPLVYFGFPAEVIDEAIFHLKPADAYHAYDGKDDRGDDYLPSVECGDGGELRGDERLTPAGEKGS